MRVARAKRPAGSDYPDVEFSSRAEMRAWLRKNHRTSPGAWFVTRKVSAGGTIAWNDLVEEVLCFGWVDSLPRKVDAERTKILVTPRRPTSKWSAKNKAHIADLEARGLLHESGRAVVEAARASGTWTALDRVSALVVPDDLKKALAAFPSAARNFHAFPPSARRGILEWLDGAKRPETRARRVEETARLAEENRRANDYREKAPK